MKRDYKDGIKNDVVFFTGTEVEHTPAWGLKTLFVVGVQPIERVAALFDQHRCEHIYLGANQSFDTEGWLGNITNSDAWDNMINSVLTIGCLTTLDFDLRYVDWVCEGGYADNDLFIPQISVKIPYLNQLGYNATLKIDDRGFRATNPGVWCHSLHDLTSRREFTAWNQYSKDQPI